MPKRGSESAPSEPQETAAEVAIRKCVDTFTADLIAIAKTAIAEALQDASAHLVLPEAGAHTPVPEKEVDPTLTEGALFYDFCHSIGKPKNRQMAFLNLNIKGQYYPLSVLKLGENNVLMIQTNAFEGLDGERSNKRQAIVRDTFIELGIPLDRPLLPEELIIWHAALQRQQEELRPQEPEPLPPLTEEILLSPWSSILDEDNYMSPRILGDLMSQAQNTPRDILVLNPENQLVIATNAFDEYDRLQIQGFLHQLKLMLEVKGIPLSRSLNPEEIEIWRRMGGRVLQRPSEDKAP